MKAYNNIYGRLFARLRWHVFARVYCRLSWRLRERIEEVL